MIRMSFLGVLLFLHSFSCGADTAFFWRNGKADMLSSGEPCYFRKRAEIQAPGRGGSNIQRKQKKGHAK